MKTIENEADYQAALEKIDRLFDVEPNTPEDDKLEVLITLVEAYEEEHYSIPKPSLIEAIKYRIQSRGLFPKIRKFLRSLI